MKIISLKLTILVLLFYSTLVSASHSNRDEFEKLIKTYIQTYGETKIDLLVDDIAMNNVNLVTEGAKNFLGTLSAQELKLIRNTLFAKHGHIFNIEDLQVYFKGKPWYKPKIEKTVLTGEDKLLMGTILSIEKCDYVNFTDFLSMFNPISLPAVINFKEKLPYDKAKEISRPVMRKFLKDVLNVYYFHPYSFLRYSAKNNIEVVIYFVSDAAGGGGEMFFYTTFSQNGKQLSHGKLAHVGGDISNWSEIIEFKIDYDLEINIVIEKSQSDGENSEKRFEEKNSFSFDENEAKYLKITHQKTGLHK